MNYSFQNIFFWQDTLHVFDQLISFFHLVIFQMEYDQIQSCFRYNFDEWWQNLKSVFTTSENNEIVAKKITVLQNVTSCWCVY